MVIKYLHKMDRLAAGAAPQASGYVFEVSGLPAETPSIVSVITNGQWDEGDCTLGHVRPKAMGGANTAENTYWISDLGNRIQGDKSWHDTVKTMIEMAE